MRVQAEFIQNDLGKYESWNLPNNIDVVDKTVIETFENNIEFRERRYNVSLPFKDNHDILEDHYDTSKERLKRLAKTFRKNPELLSEYDRIINEQVNLGVIEVAPI